MSDEALTPAEDSATADDWLLTTVQGLPWYWTFGSFESMCGFCGSAIATGTVFAFLGEPKRVVCAECAAYIELDPKRSTRLKARDLEDPKRVVRLRERKKAS